MREISIGSPPARPNRQRKLRSAFMMRVASKSRLKVTMPGKKPRPAFHRRTAASTSFRSIWLKARRAASVSSILISKTGSSFLPGVTFCQLDFRAFASFLGSVWPHGMISLQVFYEGNVQGVGFRWSIRHIAKGFDITGWVRNLVDGRVELQINGEEAEVRAFLDAVSQSDLRAHIRNQTEKKLPNPVAGHGFEIRYD